MALTLFGVFIFLFANFCFFATFSKIAKKSLKKSQIKRSKNKYEKKAFHPECFFGEESLPASLLTIGVSGSAAVLPKAPICALKLGNRTSLTDIPCKSSAG